MQVILLEKIENLGRLGDLVDVKPGYARNFLVPLGKAKSATEENIAEISERRAELEKIEAKAIAAAKGRASIVEGKKVSVTSRSGTEGKLFGSVGADLIVAAIQEELKVTIERKEIRLPEGPIRTVGEFEVGIHLHSDVDAVVIVEVIGEEE
jgi:large subunit ribosomal protein L9